MSAVEGLASRRVAARPARALFGRPRFWIYLSCTALAVLASYLLGKEMMWDTLAYHYYAGFSALHDRFGRDYFAAGAQTYLNPYVYVPFYALARSGLSAVWAAAVLAVVQSGILWLTYELAVAVSPPVNGGSRIAAGACAALLALLNPILINQIGSSYSDILTAEIVLAAWLLLVYAVRKPSAALIVGSGLLLGAVSALKLTNSLHALCACVLLLFLPTDWRRKTQFSLGFMAAGAVSFVAVAAPWAIRLEQHFGNPLFPLFNNVFHSPYFPATTPVDYRFVPSSLAEALWRPFAITLPVTYVDDEYPAPDLRYALLLALALAAVALWVWRRFRHTRESSVAPAGPPGRGLVALGCAFLADWVLWVHVSGNGRYFMAMACVAAVLGIVLTFRMLAAWPRALGCLLLALFAIQGMQVAFGAVYRLTVQWDGGPWFDVSVPPALQRSSNLYLLIGQESESYIAPFLPEGSAFVNLAGDYVLGPDGANGARIQSLLREYAGHIRVVDVASEYKLEPTKTMADLLHVNGTLASFGLRADAADCSTMIFRDMRSRFHTVLGDTLPVYVPQLQGKMLRVPQSPDAYLVVCHVVPDPGSRVALADAEREPNLIFDRMEKECPQLFQPAQPVTRVFDDRNGGYLWSREYLSTNLSAEISHGSLRLVDGTRGGRPDMLGNESDWAKAALPLVCGRHGEHFYAKVVSSAH